MKDRYDIDDGNKCDCDDDNKCGCSYPNNIQAFTCGCTIENNCGCIKYDENKKQYYHDDKVCKCNHQSSQSCNCQK